MTKSKIQYLIQTFIVFVVLVTSLINIVLHNEPEKLWLCLLATTLGIFMPSPVLKSLKNDNKRILPDVT